MKNEEGGNLLYNVLRLLDSMEAAGNVLKYVRNSEYSEKWDRKYINELPNAAFAVVEKGYKKGDNKNARHLPHHTKSVKSATENSSVDLSHYRNALSRANQIKSVLKKESDSTLRKRAASHLEKHRAVLNTSKSNFSGSDILLWEECEELFEKNIKPLLEEGNA